MLASYEYNFELTGNKYFFETDEYLQARYGTIILGCFGTCSVCIYNKDVISWIY
jgi:hypothetical protein